MSWLAKRVKASYGKRSELVSRPTGLRVSHDLTEQPVVSFIVPVLNGQDHIGRCLTAIQRQNSSEFRFEVVVVDNGSTDRTHEIVRGLGCAFEVVPGVTVSTLRNRGALSARGDFLAFIDSDVEIGPNWLSESLAIFGKTSVVAGGCFPRAPVPSTWVQQAWEMHQCGLQQRGVTRPVSWLPSMNFLVRREVFFKVNGFDERLVTAEDVDLCYRLLKHGTVLSNAAMEAVHWGEAADLKTFWRKEVWRGIGTLKGIFAHGLRLDELPSLGYPLYLIFALVVLVISCFIAFKSGTFLLLAGSVVLMTFPALALAIRTVARTAHFGLFPKLFVLYLVYGIARAYSLTRGFIVRV